MLETSVRSFTLQTYFRTVWANPLSYIGQPIKYVPVGNLITSFSKSHRSALLKHFFEIYNLGIKIETLLANYWLNRLTGKNSKADKLKKQVVAYYNVRKYLIIIFEFEYNIAYSEIPFFNASREIRLDSPSGGVFNTKTRSHDVADEAKKLYLQKLTLDRSIANLFFGAWADSIKTRLESSHIS